MLSKKVMLDDLSESEKVRTSTYGSRLFARSVPKYEIPETSMPPEAAYRIICDELNLDGNPALNLATFVNTWMEPEAKMLYTRALDKNFIDQDEYPQTKIIHDRIINMTARLFNSPKDALTVGTATIGSSEAIMLSLLAHKWNWKKRRQSEGKPYDKPNIVMGADVHTCWDKFALYFDVEPRIVPLSEDRFVLTADEVESRIDENTMAVGAILGTTFTGQVDEIEEINNLLLEVKEKKGWDIPIHVDAASCGFVAPFVFPDLKWDFRLPMVKSINVSNHKFGMVYPGMGTVVFREKSVLPGELIFKINYLGGEMPNYSLNFSRGSATILLQYYNFLRLGMNGYRRIMNNIMDNTNYLEQKLVETGKFEPLNDSKFLPVVAVRLKGEPKLTVFDLSDLLRLRGWIIPAYTLPPNAQKIAVLRMVVKENFSRDMAETLVSDFHKAFKKARKIGKEIEEDIRRERTHQIC